MMLADPEHIEPDAVGQRDLLEQIGESLRDVDRPPGPRVALGFDERVDAKLHGRESLRLQDESMRADSLARRR